MKKHEVIFYIPYPKTQKEKSAWNKRFGLNAYMGRKNYYARMRDVNDIHNLVYYCLKKDHVKKEIFKKPVKLTFEFNDRLDCSNHGALVKMIEDSIKGYLIKDDSPKYVQEIDIKYWSGNGMRVTVSEVKHDKE